MLDAPAEMLAHGIKPPLTFGRQQRYPAAPLVGLDLILGDIFLKDLTTMFVHVGNGSEQSRFATAGIAGNADAFARCDRQVDRLQVRYLQVFES